MLANDSAASNQRRRRRHLPRICVRGRPEENTVCWTHERLTTGSIGRADINYLSGAGAPGSGHAWGASTYSPLFFRFTHCSREVLPSGLRAGGRGHHSCRFSLRRRSGLGIQVCNRCQPERQVDFAVLIAFADAHRNTIWHVPERIIPAIPTDCKHRRTDAGF